MKRLFLLISYVLCFCAGFLLARIGLSHQRSTGDVLGVASVNAPRTVTLSPEVASILNAKENISEGEFEDLVLQWFKETYFMENINER